MDSIKPLEKHGIGVNEAIGVGIGVVASHFGSGIVSSFLPVPSIIAQLILFGIFWWLKYGYWALGVLADMIGGFLDNGLSLGSGAGKAGDTVI